MTRKNARELVVGMVYALGYGADPDKLLDERLSEEAYERLAGEDELFAEHPDEAQTEYITRVLSGVYEHLAELDGYIEKYAVGWKFGRLPMVALAIMRVCMYEILYMPDIPNNAAIHEAVEISKHYEPEEITSFINGILGSFVRTEIKD